MKMLLLLASLAGVATILVPGSAPIMAAPPADLSPSPALSLWFKSLKQPGTSLPCCSISDCRRVDFRIASDGQYEVMVEGNWYSVPSRLVLHPMHNPVGRAVACYTTAFGYGSLLGGAYDGDRVEILCFVPELPTS